MVSGPGIKVGQGSRAKIKGNNISKCQIGIQASNCQAFIVFNECYECYENGIVTIAKKDKANYSKVWYNFSERNKENGVLCTGPKNQTRVEKNCKLSNNMKAGVCVTEEASVIIANNRISSNFGQGILLVESTYAHIEKNCIQANYKANIAFGGAAACDTVIVNNEIKESRQEGIFCIECGFSWIYKNEISDNADGIVMFDSAPHIVGNEIAQNQRSGVTCCGASFPKVQNNQIYGNIQSGINVRDKSTGVYTDNKVFSNYYNFSCRNYKKEAILELTKKNEINGDNEFGGDCTIF